MEQAQFDSPSPTEKSRGIQEIRLMRGQTPKIRALTPAPEEEGIFSNGRPCDSVRFNPKRTASTMG